MTAYIAKLILKSTFYKISKLTHALILVCFALMLQSHEFWLQPDRYFFKPGESAKVLFRVGENFMGEPWDLNRHQVARLELHQQNESSDVRSAVSRENNLATVELRQAGTHMLVMQSNNAFIKLDGEKFNEYLREDGLDDVLYQREQHRELADSASELYMRYTKLLLQCGDQLDDTYSKVMNFPLEIVPEKNPYGYRKGEVVRFKILSNGKPLFGAKVKVWNRHNNRTTTQNIYAQQDGFIEARITNAGAWMVSVVRMVPSTDKRAQWQSYWGSLVFGVR